MEESKFYGHDNPFTKHDNGYFTQKYDPAATWWDEVLDGPNNASTALDDFKYSPAHFQALTDSKENYLGVVSVYYPESWASYDNTGKIQATANTSHSNCIVLGQLANKVGQTVGVSTKSSPAPALSSPSTSNTCYALVNETVAVYNHQYNDAQATWDTATSYNGITQQQWDAANTQYNATLHNDWVQDSNAISSAGCADPLASNPPIPVNTPYPN
jgi:hypothetical protein